MSVRSLTNSIVKTVNTNKILNNDFLYKVVVVLALLNVIGYIVSKNVNAVIMFSFVYLAINYFTKNMSVVLLSAIFATNFFIVSKKIKESFETKDNIDDNIVDNNDQDQEIFESDETITDKNTKKKTNTKESYDNIEHKLKPADIAPVEFNSDSAELAKQLKILNERTKNSMGMINKLGGIGNIGKMVDNLTSIVGKLG
jgi:hypothetical protein